MIWTAIYIIAVWLALSVPIGLLTARLMRPDADCQSDDDLADQRLERGRFSEGAQSSNHVGVNSPISE